MSRINEIREQAALTNHSLLALVRSGNVQDLESRIVAALSQLKDGGAEELNGRERGVLNVLAGTYHRERHEGDMMICRRWPCEILIDAIRERDDATAPTETSARNKECDSCHHSGPLNEEGFCMVDISAYVDPEGPFHGMKECYCNCVFPTSVE